MKKLVLVTGIILISCVLISALASPAAVAQQTVFEEKITSEEPFLIKDDSGRIAVFRHGEDKPFMVTETYTNALPLQDREKLKKGIEAENRRELQKMLEDYCS